MPCGVRPIVWLLLSTSNLGVKATPWGPRLGRRAISELHVVASTRLPSTELPFATALARTHEPHILIATLAIEAILDEAIVSQLIAIVRQLIAIIIGVTPHLVVEATLDEAIVSNLIAISQLIAVLIGVAPHLVVNATLNGVRVANDSATLHVVGVLLIATAKLTAISVPSDDCHSVPTDDCRCVPIDDRHCVPTDCHWVPTAAGVATCRATARRECALGSTVGQTKPPRNLETSNALSQNGYGLQALSEVSPAAAVAEVRRALERMGVPRADTYGTHALIFRAGTIGEQLTPSQCSPTVELNSHAQS